MNKKQQFNEALTAIVELAAAQNNTLTLDDIHSAFEGIIEEDSLYEYIFSYLADNKIVIEGYLNTKSNNEANNEPEQVIAERDVAPADTTKADNEELAYVEMYMEELKSIQKPTEEFISSLLPKHFSGDNMASKSITEALLHNVVSISNEFKNQGVTFADLIQEGNLGLVEGMSSLDSNDCDYEKFIEHINKSVREAIINAIDEQTNSTRLGVHMADRANALDHASSELAKKLEREPSLSELAKHLGLSEDEVESVMKMSLAALTIDNN